jgi:hypothetical protein
MASNKNAGSAEWETPLGGVVFGGRLFPAVSLNTAPIIFLNTILIIYL